MSFRLASILALTIAVCPRGVSAQPVQPETAGPPPAHVSYVDGVVTLERDGRPETSPLNMPLLSGDRLKTIDGRVEVLFGDGSALHLDSRTTIDLQSDELLRLIDGRLRMNVTGGTAQDRSLRRVSYRIDSPVGSIRILQAGQYRVAILRRGEETQLELAVIRGSGEIFTDEGTTPVQSGERAYSSAGLAPSYAYTYNSATWDAFDRWSESRRDTTPGVSSQYLPSEVQSYASTFDEEGDWRYQTSYGYVWYPRVATTWRPYYYGRWAHYPRYGWTWVGADRFAWPTHHYGRWGFNAGVWFWIPAARWAPAYVSWAYAPGYVSWCPLGWNNRPVMAVNYFNVGPGYYSSWHAWTAVGSSHFGRGYVHQRAVHWDRVDRRRYPSFAVARSAPTFRDVAVQRSSAIRAAGSLPPEGGRSVDSTASGARTPRYINRGDAIVRSQTELPSSRAQVRPSATAQGASSTVERRTVPPGAARRADAPALPQPPAQFDRSRDIAVPRPSTRTQGVPDVDGRPGYLSRSPYERRSVTPDRGSVAPRPDAPVYQPRAGTYDRNDGGQTPARAGQPDDFSRAPMRSPRGGFESRSAPANDGAVQRQGPPPRAAGAPDSSAPSRGTAVPRSGGQAAPAAPAAPSGGSGARAPRGRGGAS